MTWGCFMIHFVSMQDIYEKMLLKAKSMSSNIKRIGVSYPVFSFAENSPVLVFFFYEQTKEQAVKKKVSAPHLKAVLNIMQGSVLYMSSFCSRGNFDKEIDISPDSFHKPSINFHEKWKSLADDIRIQILQERILDEKKYHIYLDFILDCIPVSMRDYYHMAGINVHHNLPCINTDTKLPYGMNASDIEKLAAFCMESTIYVLLDKSALKTSNGIFSAEPAVVSYKNKDTVFISNDAYCIQAAAEKYGMSCGDIPMAGEIIPDDRYDNFGQFLKYMYASYADTVSFVIMPPAGEPFDIIPMYVADAAASLNINIKDMALAALECSSKKMIRNGKFHKAYKASISAFDIQKLYTGKESSQKASHQISCPVSPVTINDNEKGDILMSLPVIYILMDKDTGIPFMYDDRSISAYMYMETAYHAASSIENQYQFHAEILPLSRADDQEFFYHQYFIEGFKKLCIYTKDSSIDFDILSILQNKNYSSAACPGIKSSVTLYRKWMRAGSSEKAEDARIKVLVSLTEETAIIPAITNENSFEPVPLFLGEKRIYCVFTDIQELKNTNMVYAKTVQINAASAAPYFMNADFFAINTANTNQFKIPVSEYIWIMSCYPYMNGHDREEKMKKAVLISKHIEIAKEFCFVCKNKKFKQTNAVKVNGKTARDLCSLYSISVQSAYLLLAMYMENVKKADVMFEKIKK